MIHVWWIGLTEDNLVRKQSDAAASDDVGDQVSYDYYDESDY